MKTQTTRSKDGTAIAYEAWGEGPPLLLVDGALCYRDSGPSRKVAEALAQRFKVYTYDRRGRGESGDAPPYAVEREVEDIEALIEAAGGSAHVCGFSSGAALALEAARRGASIKRLALYEPPFIVDDSRPPMAPDYEARLRELLAAGRRGDMVRLFMRQVGMPRVLIAASRFMPVWSKLTAIAHTLSYDAAVMGGMQAGTPLPAERWANVTVPTLALVGGKSGDWMRHGIQQLVERVPSAERYELPGQTHMVKAKALAPVLVEFLSRAPARSHASTL